MTDILTRTDRSSSPRNALPQRRGRAAIAWLPLIVLPATAITLRDSLAGWFFMWLLAYAVFFGCKWLTWRRAGNTGRLRSLAYLFAWPGMDARDFFAKARPNGVPFADWAAAFTKAVAGAGMVWLAMSGRIDPASLLTGWIGMVGAILFLHFGVFDLLASAYRRLGIGATRLMRSPMRATSPSDFWANRWNTAFNKLVKDVVFRPAMRRAGAGWATIAVFIASGVIHDLVISLPARGGYGLPTAYFTLQGIAIVIERSPAGTALGLGTGWRGRAFMFAVTAGPAFWLFHPAFVRNVTLPMLQAFGTFWEAL